MAGGGQSTRLRVPRRRIRAQLRLPGIQRHGSGDHDDGEDGAIFINPQSRRHKAGAGLWSLSLESSAQDATCSPSPWVLPSVQACASPPYAPRSPFFSPHRSVSIPELPSAEAAPSLSIMDSDDSDSDQQRQPHRRIRTNPQSIPLQDFSGHASATDHGDGHRRTLSDRGRRLFQRSSSRRISGQYAPLTPPSTNRPTLRILPPSSENLSDPFVERPRDLDDTDLSPLADGASFQAALGFAGLSYTGEHPASTLPDTPQGLATITGHNDSSWSLAGPESDSLYGGGADVVDSDTAHLTDRANVQTPAGSSLLTPKPPRPDRLSLQTVRFNMDDTSPRGSHLGDNLSDAERGTSTSHGRSRSTSYLSSLSPTSGENPLNRASSIVRKMSQRVVNLSNEPELVKQDMLRRRSARQAEIEGRVPSSPEATTAPENPFVDGADLVPPEKVPSKAEALEEIPMPQDWVRYANPFRGKSLGVFPPDSPIRTKLCDVLIHPWTEPTILVLIILQTVMLAVDSAPNVFDRPRPKHFGSSWIDFTLLALFAVYTVEIAVRIIVSGFIVNPIEYSTIHREQGLKKAVMNRAEELFAIHRRPSTRQIPGAPEMTHPSIMRTFTGNAANGYYSPDERQKQRIRLAHRAFLRHSFNRLDFLAVVSFWISFVLSLAGLEFAMQVYVFRMLSCLRILRLLSLTAGMSIILRSLKKAAPLLLNVALLIGFFWLLFAIIGVQSFKSSLRRYCVWVDPDGLQPNVTLNQEGAFTFCGGSLLSNGTNVPWIHADGTSSGATKGYLCPPNSYCVESSNPYNGTVSFDNIIQSLELVFVVISTNTYTDIMYYLTETDYLAAALFFAGGIIVLTLWLVSLLIAVITSSFQVIREESQSSAFAAKEAHDHISLEAEEIESPQTRKSALKIVYDATYWIWIAIIIYDMIIQCLRTFSMSAQRGVFIDTTERVVTLILLFEILFRFVAEHRFFFRKRRNCFDLFLVVVTCIIQIPPIKDSGNAYAWLSIFQIARLYRVVLAVPLTRDLILLVLGNVSGIMNLMLFVLLLNFLVAILACQLFRGQIPAENPSNQETNQVTFQDIWNSFLGVYQIYSSENWTSILYNITAVDVGFNTAWIGAAFFILWFILGFFIVFNMFIAVIQENFDVDEDEKRLQQVKAFLQQKELGSSSNGVLSLSSMFKLRQFSGRRQDPLDYGSAMMDMLLKEAVVRDFLDDEGQPTSDSDEAAEAETKRPASSIFQAVQQNSLWQRAKRFIWDYETNPFYSRVEFARAYEEVDPRNMARQVVSAAEQRKQAQRDYLRRHPTYNVSLYIFKPDSKIRRACQRLVGPGRGHERIEGAAPSPVLWYIFSGLLYAAIVAMVLLACVTTPLYQKEYFKNHVYSVHNWFVFSDMAFAAIFTVESAIRVIADGAFMSPHAYFRSSWGLIDGVVLVTLWINVITSLYNEGAISRAVGAFKALRALRLLNISDSARDTFHSVIVRGGWKVVSAAFVSLSLLIPFAIWGLNLFNGRMYSCNDSGSNIQILTNCVNEYMSSPYAWDVLAPRQVSNPWYDFDDFGSSLFVLFQITSLEGWVDVMYQATSITGQYLQPSQWSAPGNAVFFVIFNLLGSVFVLTLFVSVFMRNYTEQTGVAFLTTDQRSWLELRKLLRQISPSKRPASTKQRQTWEQWCYMRAIRKTGKWQRFMTGLLIFHLILLCIEFYPQPTWWDLTRAALFFLMTLIYIVNVFIRMFGLTWTRFRRSAWDVYSLVSVTGTFIVSVLLFTNFGSRVYTTLHKLFLVSIVLLLIPRNNQLDQLFKTAAASLANIANLLATWFVLFLVYAIALTQTFGLTRFNQNESNNINFRDVPKALILLFRMSTGEGWDQIMVDFADVKKPFCTEGEKYFNSDCGSAAWANTLFVSWNVLSMYIFVNMFISLIYESFSYVYQRSSGLSVISRKEIRKFKQAWAEFDPAGTGYISRDAFPRLLGELSGIFEMRIYPSEYSVRSLLEKSEKQRNRMSELPFEDRSRPYDVDLDKLNRALRTLPVDEIRERRARLRVFYEEVMVSADPDRGISFTTLLMILAHYKVINDNKSLRLEEFLRRRARLQRVEEAVRRGIVISFFDTLYWNRRFRRLRSGRNLTSIPQLQVPEIFIEDEDAVDHTSPVETNGTRRPTLSLQIPTLSVSAPDAGDTSDSAPQSPYTSGTRSRGDSIQATPIGQFARHSGSQPSTTPPRLSIDHRQDTAYHGRTSTSSRSAVPGSPSLEQRSWESGVSPHGHGHSRSRGASSVSAQAVLDTFESSAWGESIRRSMTLKRHGRTSGSISFSRSQRGSRGEHSQPDSSRSARSSGGPSRQPSSARQDDPLPGDRHGHGHSHSHSHSHSREEE